MQTHNSITQSRASQNTEIIDLTGIIDSDTDSHMDSHIESNTTMAPGTGTCEYSCGCNGKIAHYVTVHKQVTFSPSQPGYFEDHYEHSFQKVHGPRCPDNCDCCQSFVSGLSYGLSRVAQERSTAGTIDASTPTAKDAPAKTEAEKASPYYATPELLDRAEQFKWRPNGPCPEVCWCTTCHIYQCLRESRDAISAKEYMDDDYKDNKKNDAGHGDDSDDGSDAGGACLPQGYEEDIGESELADVVEKPHEPEAYVVKDVLAQYDPGVGLLYMSTKEVRAALTAADSAFFAGRFTQSTPEAQLAVEERAARMFSNMETALAELMAIDDEDGHVTARAEAKKSRERIIQARMKTRFDYCIEKIFLRVDPADMTSREQILAAHKALCTAVGEGKFMAKAGRKKRQVVLDTWLGDAFKALKKALDKYYDNALSGLSMDKDISSGTRPKRKHSPSPLLVQKRQH